MTDLTQTRGATTNQTGFNGPHGSVASMTNAEVFGSDYTPALTLWPGEDLHQNGDNHLDDEHDRR